MTLFLYGTLLHDPLFALVAGPGDGSAARTDAVLDDHAVDRVKGLELPMLLTRKGAVATGAVWTGLTDAQRRRLDLYEVAFGYRIRAVSLTTEIGTLTADAYFPPITDISAEEPWSLEVWVGQSAQVALFAAAELDAHDPPLSADELVRQWPMISSRAHSRMRAGESVAPATLRYAPQDGDFGWKAARPLDGGFFKLAAMEMTHRTFGGGVQSGLRREVLVGVDAALLLPYDPARDRVLMVEQFRSAPARRGDPNPWTLEPVAGIVDGGETPEAAARRESVEEAHLDLREIRKMFAFYPSPGSNTDYFHCYLGLADLPDDHATHGGLESEAEDLRLHIMPRETALALVDTGEITAGPLIAMLLWLDRNCASLRGLV